MLGVGCLELPGAGLGLVLGEGVKPGVGCTELPGLGLVLGETVPPGSGTDGLLGLICVCPGSGGIPGLIPGDGVNWGKPGFSGACG